MTETDGPTLRSIRSSDQPWVSLGAVGAQQVLLGQKRSDGSPLLMGITLVKAGQTSSLIEHDTAEIAYVLAGEGWMVTNTNKHAFSAGDAIVIDARCWHSIRAGDEPVQMLYVFPTDCAPPTRTHPVRRT